VHHIAELGTVRHDLDLYLRRSSLPDEVTYDLLTCVKEASKNALRFAASPCGVQISVRVEGGTEVTRHKRVPLKEAAERRAA
jgi:anti-sigma regulatory factor (Ser/Thr protein kinase)